MALPLQGLPLDGPGLGIACYAQTPTRPGGSEPWLAGRYPLDAVLGRGATRRIYPAPDTTSGIHPGDRGLPFCVVLPPRRQALFEREGRVLRQLSLPARPACHAQWVGGLGRGRCLVLLQQRIEGISLEAGKPSCRSIEAEVLDIIDERLGVLGYLQRLSPPVLHQDIKPAKLMRRPDSSLARIDLDSAQDVSRDAQLGGSTLAGTSGWWAHPHRARAPLICGWIQASVPLPWYLVNMQIDSRRTRRMW